MKNPTYDWKKRPFTPTQIFSMQRAFDKAARHMLTQNKKCMSVGETEKGVAYDACWYRGQDDSAGLMCAVGALIDDDAYCPSLERTRADSPTVRQAVAKSGYYGLPPEFLVALQGIHDLFETQLWKPQLRRLAYDLGLNWNIDLADPEPEPEPVPAKQQRVPTLHPMAITALK